MKKDGIPPKRTGCSVIEFSPATREARIRFPASARKKILFKLLSNFCFACTQNIKIRWTANTKWLYIVILWTCYFILRTCSFIGVIRVTSPIDSNVPIKSLLALKKNGSFVSLTGSFFTNLNVYKYEILLLRTSLLQP